MMKLKPIEELTDAELDAEAGSALEIEPEGWVYTWKWERMKEPSRSGLHPKRSAVVEILEYLQQKGIEEGVEIETTGPHPSWRRVSTDPTACAQLKQAILIDDDVSEIQIWLSASHASVLICLDSDEEPRVGRADTEEKAVARAVVAWARAKGVS